MRSLGTPVGLVCLACLAPGTFAQSSPQSVFRAGVDVVLVDVHVVDRMGRPITDLSLADFEVQVDRERRRVVSADLLEVGADAPVPTPGSATIVVDPGVPQPPRQSPTPIGRNILLAVDLLSLHPRHMDDLRQPLVRLMYRLSPDDRVGLYVSPPGRVVVDLSTDHDTILGGLDRLEGQYVEPPSLHYINISEVVDIVAGDERVLRQVIERECHDRRDSLCPRSIPKEAFAKATEYERAATAMVTGLRPLFDERPSSDPLAIVLVSGGIMTTDRLGGRPDVNPLVSDLAARAARSNTTLYTIHLDTSFFDSLGPAERLTSSSMRDSRIRGLGLDRFTGLARGERMTVEAGTAEAALDRVLSETAASYLLAIAPEDSDRDGQPHQITVAVRRRGATVRSRAMVRIPTRAPDDSSPAHAYR